jgi:hypothetical protein
MKIKRGFLLAEETLKMIIAVIAIAFLAYFLLMLYFSNANAVKIEQAQQTLVKSSESVTNTISSLKDGDSKNLLLANPQGWYLFSFTGNVKPNSCSGESCLCICDRVFNDPVRALFSSWEERQATQCVKAGVCAVVPNVVQFTEIEIKNPSANLTQISIKNSNGGIYISQ